MKNEMVKSVKGRFAGIEDNYLLLVTTIVDPRFKTGFFLVIYQRTSQKKQYRKN